MRHRTSIRVATALTGPALAASVTVAGPPTIVLNEIDSDTAGFDAEEFIELYDGGDGSTSLDGLVVVLFNGNGDFSYDAFSLDGFTTDNFGYFVIGSPGMSEADIVVDPGDFGWIQNGADAVALYTADIADFPDGTPITTTGLVDAVVYGTDDPEDQQMIDLFGGPQINESGNGDPGTDSIGRFPNGDGVFTVLDEPTPGSSNGEQLVNVVINEVLADPALGVPQGDANGDGVGTTQDQFIEIVNDTGSPLDITGWALLSESGVVHEFPANTILSDLCALVVFGGGTPVGLFGGAEVQLASTGGLNLDFTGDVITVLDDGGNEIAVYEFGPEASSNQSIVRDPDVVGPEPLVHHTAAQGSGGTLFSPGAPTVGGGFSGCSGPVDPPDNLTLSELRIDQPGVDFDEYFELRGDPDTTLAGLSYVVIGDAEGGDDSGVIETVIDLDGEQLGPDGNFLVVETSVTIVGILEADLVIPAGELFENEDNVTHVVAANFFGSVGVDLDADDNGVLDFMEGPDVAPWTHVVDAVGIVSESPPVTTEHVYGAQLGFEDLGPDDGAAPGHVYRCDPQGIWQIGTFDSQAAGAGDTPAEANPGCGAGACCLGDGTCADDLTGADCATMSGFFQGPASTCGEAPCPAGACCLVDGSCIDDQLAADCEGLGGLFQGLSSTCAEGCPGGACCLVDQSCVEDVQLADCSDPGEQWQGAGVGCDGVECQPPCPEDTDGNGVVNVSDLIAVILAWGTDDPAADVDGSGIVDVSDLVAIILAWGPCT